MTCPEQQHGNEPLGGLAPSGLRVWGKFAASRQMRAARCILTAAWGNASVLRCVPWALHMLATSGIDPGCWRGWGGAPSAGEQTCGAPAAPALALMWRHGVWRRHHALERHQGTLIAWCGGLCSCGAGEQAGAEEEEEVSSEAPQVGVQVTTCMSM